MRGADACERLEEVRDQAFGNTLFGYGTWNWLLGRHSATSVAPWGLVVPVVGIASAWAFGYETLSAYKVSGGVIVLASLGLLFSVRPEAEPV